MSFLYASREQGHQNTLSHYDVNKGQNKLLFIRLHNPFITLSPLLTDTLPGI